MDDYLNSWNKLGAYPYIVVRNSQYSAHKGPFKCYVMRLWGVFGLGYFSITIMKVYGVRCMVYFPTLLIGTRKEVRGGVKNWVKYALEA